MSQLISLAIYSIAQTWLTNVTQQTGSGQIFLVGFKQVA